ncbi:MAG: MFS transporter [Steroidobacteraceae bacterium]
MRSFFESRPALSWALYDWANSAFATTVMAGFFPVFFSSYWSIGTDATVTTLRLGLANGIAGLVVAVLAPVLGAIADRGGRRIRFLVAWSVLGIAATAGLYFVQQGQWAWAAALFVVGTMGFNGGVVFCDALLLDVAEPKDYDRVSALGYGLGYLGGGLLFALNVVMVLKPALFGLADAAEAVRLSFLTVAVWWLIFMLPLALYVRERAGTVVGLRASITAGIAEIAATARSARHLKPLFTFLVAYWLYIDAVNTIIKMAVDYGTALGLDSAAMMTALLITQFVAFPASILFIRLSDRVGVKNGILIGLAVYTGVTVYAYFLQTAAEFYVMAVVIGLVQGAVQALSRSLFGRMVPPGKSAEFFGLYNMVGKFGTVLGPVLVGAVAFGTGSSRASILSLAVLFIAGALLLWRVREVEAR